MLATKFKCVPLAGIVEFRYSHAVYFSNTFYLIVLRSVDSMLDYEIHRCSRKCASTGRQFEPGEEFYSVLEAQGSEVVRLDYSTDAWEGPPEKSIGWWKSHMPEANANRTQWAPNDVMLDLFERWEGDPTQADIRYILALLLIRRRVLKEETEEKLEGQGNMLIVYCPKKDQTYQVPMITPKATRVQEIQEELANLLFANAS